MQLSRTSGRPLQLIVVITLIALAIAGVASPATARSVKKKKHKAPYAVSETVSRTSGTPGVTVTVSGRVAPKAKGRKVTLQVRRGTGGWVAAAHETLPKASTYSLRAKLSAAGSYGLRTVIAKSRKRAAGVSATRTVVVNSPLVRTWRQLAAGGSHTCGIKTDGSLWCWGFNYDGQQGTSTGNRTVQAFHTPVRVGSRTDWQQVTAGSNHTCAVAADHTLWCWGDNGYGQLGTSMHAFTVNPTPAPQHVTGSWQSVSGGAIQTCAVKTDGSAWCWGSDENGALGHGSTDGANHAAPVQVTGAGAWSSVSAGQDGACGLKTDGSLWCWGDNYYGQLATTTDTGGHFSHATPLQVGSATWSQVSRGGGSACALKPDGSLWCWGSNRYGQLANATNSGTANADATPTQVGTSADWVSVSLSGGSHSCGRQSGGAVSCWGRNFYGQIGSPSNNQSDAANPTPNVVGGSAMMFVAAGSGQSCGIRPSGAAFCWGRNYYGELGNATNAGNANPNPVPLAVG